MIQSRSLWAWLRQAEYEHFDVWLGGYTVPEREANLLSVADVLFCLTEAPRNQQCRGSIPSTSCFVISFPPWLATRTATIRVTSVTTINIVPRHHKFSLQLSCQRTAACAGLGCSPLHCKACHSQQGTIERATVGAGAV